ncbi:DUF6801 domain-containing protein [Kitasatospora sp. NPDC052896]|uniref:DUF6801 domain-containing protein n=1 Tax=Kitasatospora sp. NPDC052896 TaxID=3364061 RepID=UPI0037C6B57F
MISRRSTGRARARITLGVATAVGAAGGIVGVLGTGTAAAQTVSPTLSYTCVFPYIGAQHLSVSMNADVPSSVTVGEPSPKFGISAVTTAPNGLAQGLGFFGVRIIEGTGQASITVTAPQGDIPVSVPATIAKTALPPSGPFDIAASGTAPSLTFSQPGNGKITVGGISLHLITEDASGNPTFVGSIDVSCTLDGGQNNVAASFAITQPLQTPAPPPPTPLPPGPTPGPHTSTPGPGPVPSPAPTQSTAGSLTPTPPRPTTASPSSSTSSTSSTVSGPPTGPTSTDPVPGPTRPPIRPTPGGLGTTAIALLVTGVLVAGAAAFRFGSRLRNRRRTGDSG